MKRQVQAVWELKVGDDLLIIPKKLSTFKILWLSFKVYEFQGI